LTFYKRSAELNNPNANNRLGLAYAHGELGLTVDLVQSFYWTERASSHEQTPHFGAMSIVAEAYLNGSSGVAVDKVEGMRLKTIVKEHMRTNK